MSKPNETTDRLLLHACCGPCSLEPIRTIQSRGQQADIYYSNSNIWPESEYAHRLDTIRSWAEDQGIELIADEYDNASWVEEVPKIAGAAPSEDRCRACYRMRFGRSAEYAAAHGYRKLGTTLSVSPYQYTSIIAEELQRACDEHGLECAFEDYSPLYPEATRRSKDLGMYRQNFCGCIYSAEEAESERRERKAARDEVKRQRAEKRAVEEREIAARKRRKQEYELERAHRRQILKGLREERAHEAK